MKNFNNGFFYPENLDKYVGNKKIFYRSGWEYKFMTICDKSEKILKWSSEPFPIKYFSPIEKKIKNYYVDFWVEYKINDVQNQALIEIKPKNQTQLPDRKSKKNYESKLALYTLNLSKWKSAKEFAEQHNMLFLIITEENLNIFK